MKAILREIEVPEYEDYMLKHPVKMLFAESSKSDDLYVFGTTFEDQFCTKDEYDWGEGLSDKLLEEKLNYAKSLVGKTFEINLYRFTVSELTNNRYKAFETFISYGDDDDDIKDIEVYHIATYMTKEDFIKKLKLGIVMKGVQGITNGITEDGDLEEITPELFFAHPIPEKKHFAIPYNKYPNLNNSYIANEIPLKDINKGRNLAYQIKEYDFPKYDFDRYIHEIEEYRLKIRAAKNENESLRMKLFFWKPKVVVEEPKLSSNAFLLLRDCIILGKEYPSDCDKADKEYAEECEKSLRERYMHDDVETEYKEKYFDYCRALKSKYKGKSVIKVVY